jgi:eukaryotic-like serine/threonine-protein kinase
MIQAGTKLGRYEIRSKLGVGGMGEVFLAHDAMLDRKVALKILPPELASNQNRMRRFTQEAKAAAALNHPNIAHIYEIGEHEGMHFIAMEYVDGSTLRKAIHHERIGIPKLLRYLQQVAEGLTKAHAAGIVHRDLKPENVMITRDGYPKILDFGLAKLTEPLTPESMTSHEEATTELLSRPLSTPGLVMGTVGYMSPEQAQGHPVDHRSDIFAFGCLLYEAATGQRAFESESTIDTLHKIVHTPARLVRDINPSAPADLTRIVRRCLAKDPDDRYQSIREAAIELRDMRRELEGAIEMETTVPPPSDGPTRSSATTGDTVAGTPVSTSPSSAEYLFSGIKRHKLATAGVLATIVLGSIAIAAYLYSRLTTVAIDSIAVLPFVNQNRDPDTEYLSDGLTESITNSLSQLSNLRVIPSPSVARYKTKEIDAITAGKELGVRAILTGRILQRGESLTVNATLIDVRHNKQLWGEQYNRKVADALAVQQEISREISERLRTRLSGEEQKQLKKRDTSNPEAYQAYIRGRYYWNKRTAENVKKAMEQFQQAADKDPNYALAYVGLADCYVLLIEYAGASTTDTVPKSIAFAERALQLDPSLGEAHASLGWCYFALWQWERAESEFKQAIELNPNYATAHQWYSLLLRDKGRFDEAVFEIKRAQELDPLSLIIGQSVAQSYLLLKGDVSRALEEARRVVDLDPNYPRGREALGWVYLKQGRNSEAIAELQKAVAAGGDRRIFSSLGYVLAISGKKAEALKLLKEVQAKYERHEALGRDVAGIYAGLGDKDQVFIWLEKDFQARVGPLSRIRWEPPFESVRSDPRFADLLRRMGLQP